MNEFLSAPPERGGPIGSKPTVHVSRRITVYQIPDSTGCCSESIGYVRMSCLIVGQRATAREHLCNDCATKNATLFADRLWNRDKSFRSQKLSFIRLLPIMFGKVQSGLRTRKRKAGWYCRLRPYDSPASASGYRSWCCFVIGSPAQFRDRFRSLSNVNLSGSQNASKNAAAAAEKTE